MTIQVKGSLVAPITGAQANAEIKIVSKINYGQTTKNSVSTIVTSSTGAYDFPLVNGKHLIAVKYSGSSIFTSLGTVSVGDDSPSPIDLITLLASFNTEPDPILVNQLQIIAAQAAASAQLSTQKASESSDAALIATQQATIATEQADNVRTLFKQREDIIKKATLRMHFDKNEYFVYEEPFGMQPKEITQVLTTERATAGTYQSPFGLRVAEPNVPRITYDEVTGMPLGLLCERTSTNFRINSKLTDKTGIIEVGLVGEVSSHPQSNLFNKYVVEGEGQAYLVLGANLPSGNYVVSVYLEEPVNFSTSSLFWASGIGTSSGGYDESKGFPQRVEWAFSAPDGITSTGVRVGLGTTSTMSGRLVMSRPQIEEGVTATSFIVTEASSVTRVGDFNYLTNLDMPRTEFSILIDVHLFNNVGGSNTSSYILSINNGGTSEFLGFVQRNTGEVRVSQTGGASFISAGVLTAGKYKIAVTCKDGTTSFYINGQLIGSSGFTVDTSLLNTLSLFNLAKSSSFQGSGIFNKLLLLPKALSKSDVEEWTK